MTESIQLFQTAVVSLISAGIGGALTYVLSIRRDQSARRRELVTKHLIEIWRDLDVAGQPRDPKDVLKLEQVVSDIQLFGSEEMIKMAREAATEMSAKHSTDTTKLLTTLRDALRSELGLPATSQKYVALRISWPANEDHK
jgi:hypothetical protein